MPSKLHKIFLSLALGLVARAGVAQPAEAPPEDDQPPAPPAPIKEALPEPVPPPQEARPVPSTADLSKARPGLAPWERQTGWFTSSTLLSWTGGLQTDTGYSRYTHDNTSLNPEEFYDFRGRFVLGPVLRYDFGDGNYFFRATAQLVAWVREQPGIYQVNVDDVYGQVGRYGVWDFQLGSFMMWRVYRKGLGFDLYTLEDTGAILTPPLESGGFHVHTYEASYLFFREQPGHAAFHFYPTTWSGVELGGVYGKDGTANTAGGRLAANLHFGILSLSAAGEIRYSQPAVSPGAPDANNVFVGCDNCGLVRRFGFGGGAVVAYKPLELGLNAARGNHQAWSLKDGTPDKANRDVTTSLGGYVQLDVGTLLLYRPIIVGAGVNRTELLAETNTFDRHVQSAVYVAVPLGFNNAMVKIVASNANGHQELATGPGVFQVQNDKMYAARVRLSFSF
jgi:hypothetical protein